MIPIPPRIPLEIAKRILFILIEFLIINKLSKKK